MSSPSSDASPDSAVQYAYMFEKDKGPTKQLDALLRAIARHVVRHHATLSSRSKRSAVELDLASQDLQADILLL